MLTVERISQFLNKPANPGRRKVIKQLGGTALLMATYPFVTSFERAKPFALPSKETLQGLDLKGFAHNAANIDQYRDFARFDNFLDSLAYGVEIDLIATDGVLFGGHARESLIQFFKEYPDFIDSQRASRLIEKATRAGKHIHLDIKGSIDTHELEKAISNLIDNIPGSFDVYTSGKDWDKLDRIRRSAQREVKTLYTINGQGSNTFSEFLARRDTLTSSERLFIGASVKDDQATPRALGDIRSCQEFSLVYGIENPQDIVSLGQWGASGITSDDIDILNALAA